jgi:hypothetical protein
VFSTVTGKQFVYNFDGNIVRPEHTKRNIPRSDFEKAHALMPLKDPGQINQLVQGPAYVYAILTDRGFRSKPISQVDRRRTIQAKHIMAPIVNEGCVTMGTPYQVNGSADTTPITK